VLDDEQGATAAGFWHRAHGWFAAHGITIERVLTDIHCGCRLDRPVVVQLAA
jgi:hypothetical protein